MSETKDDVNVERTKPLEGVEGSGEVVEDGDEDEGGAVVRVSKEEVKEVKSEVGVAEGRVSLSEVPENMEKEELTVRLVERSLSEVVALDEGSILKTFM